mgnify:CR=1 FL=1
MRNPYTCEMKDRILHELEEELVQTYTLLSSSIEEQSETRSVGGATETNELLFFCTEKRLNNTQGKQNQRNERQKS